MYSVVVLDHIIPPTEISITIWIKTWGSCSTVDTIMMPRKISSSAEAGVTILDVTEETCEHKSQSWVSVWYNPLSVGTDLCRVEPRIPCSAEIETAPSRAEA